MCQNNRLKDKEFNRGKEENIKITESVHQENITILKN